MNKNLDITKTGPLNYKNLQEQNTLNSPILEEIPILLEPFKLPILTEKLLLGTYDINTNYDLGSTRYDLDLYNISQLEHVKDIRAEEQSVVNKLGSSLVKGAVIAGTTFVDGTLGLITGLGMAMNNSFNLDSAEHREGFLGGLSYLWDNEVSNGLLEINKIVENAIPNYSSDWEDNAPVWKKLGTANFWGEGVLKNMGFMVGAFYSGAAWTKALKAASILGKTSTMGARVTGSLLSATNEARIEANQTVENLRNLETLKLLDGYDKHYNDIINSDLDDASKIENLTILNKNLELEQLNIEDKMAKVGAIDFVSNVPLLMFDDFMLFGKLYSRGFSDAADVAKKIKGGASPLGRFKLILQKGSQLEAQEMSQVAKEGTQYIAKKVTDKELLVKSLKSAVREGNEELAQQMFSNFSGDLYAADGPDAYYNALYNPNAEVKVNKFIPSLVKSFNESYGTGSQWEQFAVGAISSLIGMPTFGKMNNSDNNTYIGKGKSVGLSGGILGEIKSQKATNEEAVLTADALNKVINRLADLKRHFVQTQSFTNAMDGFSEELDKFLYKNAEDNSDFSAIETFSKAGRIDDYLAIIDLDFENLSDEELNKIAATSSTFDAEGKAVSGWKTIDGNLMSSTDLNTSEGKDLMRKELAENRDKMKKQVSQYSEAVLRVQGLGNNTFTPEQTQELSWLLWKSEQFADRYKAIKEANNDTFNKYISVLNRAEESILHTREGLTLDMVFEDDINLFELNSHELEVVRTLRNFLSNVQVAATPAYLYYIIDKHPEVKDFIKDENIFNYTQYLAASDVKYSDYTKAMLDLIDCRRLATVANQFLERFKEFTENPEKIEKKRAIKADNAEVIANAKKNINIKTQINGLTISLVVRDLLKDASKFDDLDKLLDLIDSDALIKVKEAKLILDKKDQIQQNLSEKIQQGIIPEEAYEDALSLLEKSLSNAESLQEFTDLDRFSYQDIDAIEENLQKAEHEFESLEEFDEAILDRIDAARTLLAETFDDVDIDDLVLKALPDALDSLNDAMEVIDADEDIPTLNELELIKQKENSEESLLLLTVVKNFETAVESKASLTKEETGQVLSIVKDVISEAAVLQKKNITLEETKLAIADTDAIDKLDKIIVNPEKLEIIFNEIISAIDTIFKSPETKDENSYNVESEEIQMSGADLIPEDFEKNNSRLIPEKTEGNYSYWKPTTTEVPMYFTKGELIPYHETQKVIASKGTTPEYTRMKATHKYLKSLNAWENAYNAKKGDTVEIIIDPKLNTDAGQTVLLLQSNGKIVGDLIAEHDNIAVNQLYLPAFINSVLKEFKIWQDAGNTGKFIFSNKTTIALKLIGKVPYSDVSDMKTLNEIHKTTNSEGQQVSVPFKLGIVMDDEGRVLMTPGRRAMDQQSEEETTILPKLRSKVGQPVLLMPTGVAEKAFIPVDITMPRYGLHPNISAKIDAFIDLSLNSITALLKGFEVKWILSLQELLSIPVMHVNIDNANNIKITVSSEKNGSQSTIYNGPLSNPNLPNILKNFLIGTPYLFSRKYINKTFKNGEDYNTMMGELAIANLPVGGTHTISTWFTMNPISERGTQVEAAPIRSLQDNPLKTSRLFSTYTHVDKNGTRVIKVDNKTFEVFDGTTGKKLSGVNSDIYAARTFISVNKSILTVPKDNIVATQWGDFNVKTRKFVDKPTSNPVYSFTSDELSNIGDIAVESKLGTSIGTFGKDLLKNNTEVQKADIERRRQELLDTQASEKGFISNPKDKKIWAALNDNDKQLLLNAPTIKAKEVLTVLSYNFNFIKKEFTSPQNITELLNPTKYRLELKIARIDAINIRKEARWFAKVLPNLNREARLRIQEGIIKTANNLNAWGSFKDGVVTISKGAASGTIYHEAFHAVINLLLTKSELETVFSEARRIYGNKSSIELEELLAEDFRKYVLFLEKPIIGNTVSIFRTLKHIINNIIGKEIYLDSLFYRISRGGLKNRTNTSNKTLSIKEGVSELFDSNPELANEVYEALGFKDKLKTSLGKELEYKDPYVPASRLKDFKQYQVLDEKGDDIGTVVIEYRGKDTVILHPKLNVVGKGYGKDLYKFVSNKFNVSIEEWNEGAISNSSASKKMWASLEKDGDAKRIVDEEQGDNFRLLNYTNQITPQQKQQAQQLYSQYLDTIFPDSKVKDIVYHISKSKIKKFDKKYLGSETSAPDTVLGFFFTDNLQSIQEMAKEKEKQLKDLGVEKEVLGSEITRTILNLKVPKTYNGFTQGVWRDLPDFEGRGETFKTIKREGSKKDYEEVRSRAIEKGQDGIIGALSIDMDEDGQPEILAKSIVAFAPEQIHILGSKQDIGGFREFINKGTWEELFERYQNTKFEYINLNEENKQYLKDKKITRKIYDRMTRLEKEILFHCKA